jgi:hypothetical protein
VTNSRRKRILLAALSLATLAAALYALAAPYPNFA